MRKVRHWQNETCNRLVLVVLLGAVGLLFSANPAIAALVPIDNTFDIYRNNTLVQKSLSSTSDYLPGGLVYDWNQDTYPQNKAIAHSGSSSGNPLTNNPQLYQHVYGYSLPDTETVYQAANQTGNTRTLTVTEEDANKKAGKSIKIKSNAMLDGSLLLVKSSDNLNGYEGLLAAFDILITRDYVKNDIDVSKTLAKGSVKLIGLEDGKVKIKTTGKIKKSLFTIVQESDDIFKIVFDEASITYKTKVKVGEEFAITTTITSMIESQGYGTGAEVIFAPDMPGLPAPALPAILETGEIPEPATPLLMLIGTLVTRFVTKRKKQITNVSNI